MPKRSSSSASAPRRAAVLLTVMTIALFAAGEALIMARTDSGRLTAARYFGIGEPAEVTKLLGRHIRNGLESVGIPRDSVRESVAEVGGKPRVRWRVGLKPGASLLQANSAVTATVEKQGGVILSGREHPGKNGAVVVEMEIGLPRQPTHDLLLVRPPMRAAAKGTSRVAVVLFGFGDDPERAGEFFKLPLSFAVALPPAAPNSEQLFRAARESGRELVLHLPLEPINYPQVDPGPGTLLVSMKPGKIAGLIRNYLDDAGTVAAVANHQGSLATQDATTMRAIYSELRRRHIPFLHVTATAGAVCKPLAAELGVAYEEPDLVLDVETKRADTRALDQRWNEALKLARARGSAIVMVRATPLTRRWLSSALSPQRLDGLGVAPISAVLKYPGAL